MTRDEMKRMAKQVMAAFPKDFSAHKVARAYLALREQVETVALPALRSNLGDIEKLNELAEALGVMPFTHMEAETKAAIKAIEEGK